MVKKFKSQSDLIFFLRKTVCLSMKHENNQKKH